jgi:hypothetical protein
MLGLKSFRTAAITLAGVELAHRIRKGQFALRPGPTPELSSFRHRWHVRWSAEIRARRPVPPDRDRQCNRSQKSA